MLSVSVLYRKKESEDKNIWSGDLGFHVAHLTNSLFEAVEIRQGGVRCWQIVPLNDC